MIPSRWPIILASVLVFILMWCVGAFAQDHPPITCPTTQPCKVIVLTAEEINALVGPNMILDSAQQGRFLDLTGPVTYMRNKLNAAPAGTPLPEPGKP